MSIDIDFSEDKTKANIRVSGELNLENLQKFRDSYADFDESIEHIAVDLSNTNYIDSSGLGMLLILNDRAKELESTIEIKNPNEVIYNILKLANFKELFEIN